MALSQDAGGDSLADPQKRLGQLEARLPVGDALVVDVDEAGDESLVHRIARLELELKSATAILRTQGAMLRNGVQEQGAKVVRAREVQALTAAEVDGRLVAMEKQLNRLLGEIDLVRQEQAMVRGVLGLLAPLRRLGSSSLRRVTSWIPTRGAPPAAPDRSQHKPKDDQDSTVKLMLRGLPSQVLAWKKLLGKRR